MKKVLVYASHPDDEVIGVGGTIKKHTNSGDEVRVVIISEGVSAQYEDPQMRELMVPLFSELRLKYPEIFNN